MERRNFVLGLGALAAGGSAAVGTGAFSSATVERDVTVDVADDANAYLGLESTSDYALDDGGQLALDFTGNNPDVDGEGFNLQGITTIEDVFAVRNQGAQDDVEVAFDPSVVLDVDLDGDIDSGFLGLYGTFWVVINATLFIFVPGTAQIIDSGQEVLYDVVVAHTAAGVEGGWEPILDFDFEEIDDPAEPQDFDFTLTITAETTNPGTPADSPPDLSEVDALTQEGADRLGEVVAEHHYAGN